MKNNKSYFTLAALTFLLAMSCKKKEEIAYIDPELKEHFSFKKGSYWIYRDSATGSFDTFTVYDNTNRIAEYTEIQEDYVKCSIDPEYLSGKFQLRGNSITYLFYRLNYGCGTFYDRFSDATFLQTCTVRGVSFDSVVKAKPDSSAFYFRKDVGLIKIILLKDTIKKVWELEQYNIIK